MYSLSLDITPVVYKARWLITPFFTAPFLTNSKILMHIAPLALDKTPVNKYLMLVSTEQRHFSSSDIVIPPLRIICSINSKY